MSIEIKNKKYCIYRHITLDTNEVFYIGVGSIKRSRSKQRTKYWNNIVNKHGYEIQILKKDLSWEDACELERILIAYYGRRDLNTGILVNLTNGGEGAVGVIRTPEYRKYLSNRMKGFKHSDETKLKISIQKKGIIPTEKQILAAIKANTGKITSIETKNKISLTAKNRNRPIGVVKKRKIINTKTNMIYNSIHECARMENLNYSTLQRKITGFSRIPTHFTYYNE